MKQLLTTPFGFTKVFDSTPDSIQFVSNVLWRPFFVSNLGKGELIVLFRFLLMRNLLYCFTFFAQFVNVGRLCNMLFFVVFLLS